MSGEIVSLLKNMLAIFFCGLSIKMMDDFLDQEYDLLCDKKTLVQKLDKATLPYSLLLLMVALVLNPSLAGSLFLASYIVGMGKDLFYFLPSRLPSYGEMILGLLLGISLFGFLEMTTSLAVVYLVQLLDDLHDYFNEKERIGSNLVERLGKVECILLTVIFFFLSLIFSLEKTLMVLALTPAIICFLEKSPMGKESSNRMVIAILVIITLTTFLLGYTIGKKYGKMIGYKTGLLESPLLFRQESLEKGYCLICGTKAEGEKTN